MAESAVDDIAELKQKLQSLQQENNVLKQIIAKGSVYKQSKEPKTHDDEYFDELKKNDADHIKLLLSTGKIGVNDVNSGGLTLLMNAAIYGNYEKAQLFINFGANLDQTDGSGETALNHANTWNQHHIQRLLLLNSMGANVSNRIQETANDLKKQNGIIENITNELYKYDSTTRPFFENTMIDFMIKIIRNKSAFSDLLLNLCWEFICINNKNPLESDLWKSLKQMCAQIIKNGDKKDWFYFKTFIIPSNIWLKKINIHQNDDEKNNTSETETETFLYYKLLELVEEESIKQINTLKNGMNELAQSHKVQWEQLTQWDIPDGAIQPRQDMIPNGIESRYSKLELLQNTGSTTFVPLKFYDYNQYLSRLILLAHTVDDDFQKSVQHIFAIDKVTSFGKIIVNHSPNDDEKVDSGDGAVRYMRGPVKVMDRARSKAEIDYPNEIYPTVACVLDLNRCSLIFNDIATLLTGLQLFVNKVQYYQSESIIGIIRDKNGFIEYLKETQYADIKLNVLIKGNKNNIIGEVQFLLKTMKEFKDRAHNLYSIQREKEYIDHSVSSLLPILMDKDKELFIAGSMGDVKALCRLMTIRNATQNDIMKTDRTNDTILSNICYIGHLEAFKFVKNVLDTELFIDRVFLKSEYTQNPIEYTIVTHSGAPQKVMIDILFKMDEVLQRYNNDSEQLMTVIYWTLKHGNVEIIEFIFNALKLTNQVFKKMINSYSYTLDAIEENTDAQTALEKLDLNWKD